MKWRIEMSLTTVLDSRDGWDSAVSKLESLLATNGTEASTKASNYASTYKGRRPAMVFDVVASRQRQYEARVLPMVARFEESPAASSLAALAKTDVSPVAGLRRGEWETIRKVAAGLTAFGTSAGITSEDQICLRWALATEELRFAHRLDPFVGAVSGIGPALFAYARMRSGARALKPDLRLKNALKALGLEPPAGEIALLVICEELARAVEVDNLVFDQLLWGLNA